MENKSATLNVKKEVEETKGISLPDFITKSEVNKDAAYERKRITEDVLEMWREEINKTDTNNTPETLKNRYSEAMILMKLVIEEEMKIVNER